jgi:soluble lytic murein transglycosylase-like protein
MKFSHLLSFLFSVYAPYCVATQSYSAILVEQSDEIIIQNDFSQNATFDQSVILLRSGNDEAQPNIITRGKLMRDLPYQPEVNAAAHSTKLSPALLHAVIATESGHKHRALSSKGAFGLMQLMPATARTFNIGPSNSAEQQIMAGATYLKGLITRFHGDLGLALAAYNAGPGAVEKYENQIPPYAETEQYVRKVYRLLHIYELQN